MTIKVNFVKSSLNNFQTKYLTSQNIFIHRITVCALTTLITHAQKVPKLLNRPYHAVTMIKDNATFLHII